MHSVRRQLERFEQVGPVRFRASLPEGNYAPVQMWPTQVPEDLRYDGRLVPHALTQACAAEISELFAISNGDIPLLLQKVAIDDNTEGMRRNAARMRTVSVADTHNWHFESSSTEEEEGFGLTQDEWPTARPFTFIASAQAILYKLKFYRDRCRLKIVHSGHPKTNDVLEIYDRLITMVGDKTIAEALKDPLVRGQFMRLMNYDLDFGFSRDDRFPVSWTQEPAALLSDSRYVLHTPGVKDPLAKATDYGKLRKWFWKVPSS